MNQLQKDPSWAFVEYGKRGLAGLVTSVTVGSTGFLKIEVPDLDGKTKFTALVRAGTVTRLFEITKQAAITYSLHDENPYTDPVVNYGPAREAIDE